MNENNTSALQQNREKQPKQYKVYLAGPVTGLSYEYAFKQFEEAEKMLLMVGQKVINPMRIVPKGTDWQAAMKICINFLLQCNAFYMLPNWKDSRGAVLEFQIAVNIGIEQLNDAVVNDIRERIEKVEKDFNNGED